MLCSGEQGEEMPSAEEFRAELRARLSRAGRQGRSHAEINAGELHRSLGGYPGTGHQMPSCCNVMRQEFDPARDEIVHEPNAGQGASLTIRYRLPRLCE
jgi:5-methylcytosine-specific restriction protein A